MPLRDIILFVLVLAGLIASWIINKKIASRKVFRLFMLIPVIACFIHLLICGFNLLLTSLYLAAILIFVLSFVNKKIILRIILSLIILAMPVLPIVLIANKYPEQEYASLSYTEAFTKLNNYFRSNYALSGWKNIDFDRKYNEFKPLIESAQNKKSETEYYIALKKYLDSFNDSHMQLISAANLIGIPSASVSTANESVNNNYYGFSLLKLDDGNTIAVKVDEKSAAYQSGIRNGTVITKWNNTDMDQFTRNFSMPWIVNIPNKDNESLLKGFYIASNSGKQLNVSFIGQDGFEKSASLNSYGGKEQTKNIIDVFNCDSQKSNFHFEILNGGHGYLYISDFESDDFTGKADTVKAYINELKKRNAKDLIIDIRNNGGGYDELGAAITALFTKKDMFYINESRYNHVSNSYSITRTLNAKSNYAGFDKPVVIMVNYKTCSAAEGFAYNMSKLDNVSIAGITGTNGSFGTINSAILMPGNFVLIYPSIACIDQNHQVMIDCKSDRMGGVRPDIKILLDKKAADLIWGGTDYELNYVKSKLESGAD